MLVPPLDGIGICVAGSVEGCVPETGVVPPIGIGVEPSATGGWLDVPVDGIGIAGPAGGKGVGPTATGGIDMAEVPGGMA